MSPTRRLTDAERDQRGFSIMELVVVCSILGVMAMLAYPRMQTFMGAQETKESATQMAGVLEMARSRAIAEATPHLVFVNDPTGGGEGACGPVATVVRDLDRDYTLSEGDRQDEVSLSPEACKKVKQLGEDGSATLDDLAFPLDDLAARVGALADPLLGGSEEASDEEDSSGSDSGSSDSGSSGSDSSGKTARVATVAETLVNGATFPIDEESGRPVVAFSERGIPVDQQTPTRWGSGAGAIYLTDGQSALYAAIVNPLGGVQLKKYEATTSSWR
jgi:prepilin-type N-terminal cleavage/methylation domain-containing protein